MCLYQCDSLSLSLSPPSLLPSPSVHQATSAHPLTVVRSSMTANAATYRISLTDPHSMNFTGAKITFTSSHTHQKEVVLVSYTSGSTIQTCPTDDRESAAGGGSTTQVKAEYGLPSDHLNLVLAVITAVVLLLATVVVCLALRQSSFKRQDGFASRLPPNHSAISASSSPAFVPQSTTPTSASRGFTPLLSQSTGQSAFRRPTPYNKFSPNRISPQHGLFSQQ